MIMQTKKPEPPTEDKRWKIVDATMRRNGSTGRALIETLHTVQDTFGYLEDSALEYVALSLSVPFSKVYGVATFYHFFTLKPKGEHTCVLCTGTACYIKGISRIAGAIESKYGIKDGETTGDNRLSILSARCVGSCGLAPVAVIDGDVVGDLDEEAILDKLGKLVDNDS